MRPDAPRVSRPRSRARVILPALLLPVLLLALLLGPAAGAASWSGGDDRCDPPPYRAVVKLGASQAEPPSAPIAPAPPEPTGALAPCGAVSAASVPALPDHRPRGPPARRTP